MHAARITVVVLCVCVYRNTKNKYIYMYKKMVYLLGLGNGRKIYDTMSL